MERLTIVVLASAVAFLCTVHGQTNGVKENLRPCYNVSSIPGILSASNRPPASLNIFLEIIRRLEDANPTKSPRELSVLIIQRLRQDGIIYTGADTDLRYGLPFSPWAYDAFKGTLIGQQFLQNPTLELYYGDLDPIEICALHYMISSSINTTRRGDESTTCSGSARYTSRIRRSGEVELLESTRTFNQVQGNNELSQCPVEQGVFYTSYGTIKGGQVLNGIATGLNQQSWRGCDNRYAATVAGETAEAALIQARETINIGVPGGWRSTINPTHYYLQKNNNLDVTDAEIRGSLDGLYMSLKMDDWKSSDVKISQILDMYYSPYQKGVFDSSFKACNRNILYSELVMTSQIRSETVNFMYPLDEIGTFPTTISNDSYSVFANSSTDSFISSLPLLNDLACAPVDSNIERVSSDLLIFLDSSWSYTTVQPLLSYIFDNTDVNKFGSRYMIFSGSDLVNVTSNSTRSILDFYKQYNSSSHLNLKTGFDYLKVYQTMESIVKSKLNNNSYAGGESTIALLMPKIIPDQNQAAFMNQKKDIMRQFIPDLTVLVLGSGTQGDYDSVLVNPSKDFITLTETTNENEIKNLGEQVVNRIKNVPRSIVNPSCGSEFVGSTNSFTLTEYVEPKGVVYYRIAPNYFHSGGQNKYLKINELSYGSISVCISREQSRPDDSMNGCKTVRSSVLSEDLSTYCGERVSDCSPIYISVTGNTTLRKCKDYRCRFPDDIKYTISLEDVGCASGAYRFVTNILIIFTSYLLLRF